MGVPSVNDKTDHDTQWADFLSSGARLRDADFEATNRVLNAVRLERDGVADGSVWAKYLSGAAQSNQMDSSVVQPVMQAVHLERQRAQRWRLNITRFVASAAAAAAVVAAVMVFTPSATADPSDAYSAYQEAARGW
jgi:sugar phosphate isomerase/epimerase